MLSINLTELYWLIQAKETDQIMLETKSVDNICSWQIENGAKVWILLCKPVCSPDIALVPPRHEKQVVEMLMLFFNKISWTLSIKMSDFVNETEAIETNSITTSFFSSSYALRNNPIISFLAADVASSANSAEATVFIKSVYHIFFQMRIKNN